MNRSLESPPTEKDVLSTPPFASPPADFIPPLRSDSRPPSPMSPEKKSAIPPPLFLEPMPQVNTHQRAFSMFSLNLYPVLPGSPSWMPGSLAPDEAAAGLLDLHTRADPLTSDQEKHAAAEALACVSADAFAKAAAAVETAANLTVTTTSSTSTASTTTTTITTTAQSMGFSPTTLSASLASPGATGAGAVDQSMFLTKDAHIKRPRNAWIHFRCHYGQALKTKDPTLRAEEISRRASRRWARMNEREKKPWHDLAEQEKQAHKEAFPEYRYCPKRTLASQCDDDMFQLASVQSNSDEMRRKRAKRRTA